MQNQEELQEELRRQVEARFGIKPELRRHFDLLSKSILEATNEQISSTTLRRFWGYQEADKKTSIRTFSLDLMSHYTGYRNWADFKQKHQQEEAAETEGGSTTEEILEGSSSTDAVAEDQPSKIERQGSHRVARIALSLIAIAAVAMLCMFVFRSRHYDFEQDGLYYNITSEAKGTVELTYDDLDESEEELDITIPTHVQHGGKTYTVTAIGDSAFAYEHGLIAVVIPPTITRIGPGAFKCCLSLSHINMPDAVTEIGDWAMRCCDTLSSIRLSANIREIPAYCFSHCKKLEEVEVPAKVKKLNRDAFGDCFKLRRISLPESLEHIDRGVFWNCYELKEINIPEKVKSFGDFVFWGCNALKAVHIHNPQPARITNIFKKAASPRLFVPTGAAASYSAAMYWNKLDITEE